MSNQQDNTSLQETKPLVSFIVTYYNLPVQMLCECIESILALSLRPFEREIILVDDGSETSPMNALLQFADDIIYIRKKNDGVSKARNTGMRMASGTYIQFVDADDTLILSNYEHCLDIIRYQKDDVDMVLFDFNHSRDSQKTSFDVPAKTSGSEYMKNHNIHGTACCYIFRQSIRKELEFSPEINYGEDEEFTSQLLLRAENLYVTSSQAYYYRQHQTSAIGQSNTTNKEKRLHDNKDVIIHLQQLCDKLPHNDKLALQRRVAQLTMDYIYNTIMLTQSRQALNECIDNLRSEGLFPLPDRNYSTKYVWFRRMTNTAVGRTLLLHTLPLLKKER